MLKTPGGGGFSSWDKMEILKIRDWDPVLEGHAPPHPATGGIIGILLILCGFLVTVEEELD